MGAEAPPVLGPDEDECDCRREEWALDDNCDYIFTPAIEACHPSDHAVSDTIYFDGPEVINSSNNNDVYLRCGFPIIYDNFEGYAPELLSRVSYYAVNATANDLDAILYGSTLVATSGDLQDNCDHTGGSSSVLVNHCDTSPLDDDQFLVWMTLTLPYYNSVPKSSANAFVLCYDPDGI